MIVFIGVLTVHNCFQDDRNLTDEMKKPLRHQQLEQKKIMLINHYRGSANVSYFYLSTAVSLSRKLSFSFMFVIKVYLALALCFFIQTL